MIGGWAAVMPRAGYACGVPVAARPKSQVLRARRSSALYRAQERPRAVRVWHGSALLALGLLIAGVYGAVLSDPGAALRLEGLAPRASAIHAAGEPAPGTARQAWYRAGVGTVVNPLLGIAYPGFSSWLALAAASAGLEVNASEPAPGTANQAWYRAGLGTVINPLLQITYPGSLAWLASPEPGAARARPWPTSFAMLSALEPARGASGPAAGGTSSMLATDSRLTGRQASTEGFLDKAFAGVAPPEGVAGGFDDEPIFELGPDGALHARIGSAQALALYLEDADYDLALVRDGLEFVPRRYVASLPPDLEAIESVDERKQLFIKAVLPMILRVNEELESDRRRLQSLAEAVKRGDALKFADQLWLDTQYERYEVEPGRIEELLSCIDIIPPSLAIAQAAEESGWGTSRFAREGNALFGQYTDPDGPGIEPMSEEAAGRYRIRSYDSLYETVRSYALNLNHHKAYQKFRSLRAELRSAAAPLDGDALAGTLTRYSERGKAYVKTIRVIMKENGLRHFDGVRLHDHAVTRIAEQARDSSS